MTAHTGTPRATTPAEITPGNRTSACPAPSSSAGAGSRRADAMSRFAKPIACDATAGSDLGGGRERDNRASRKTASCSTPRACR
jgi:hypothetical protein